MRHSQIKRLTALAMFLAMSVVLHYVESLIPVFIPVPGVKLGLANSIGLLVLYFFNRKDFVFLGFLRVLLVGLISTGIFTSAFFLSLSGWLLSTILVLILSSSKNISIYPLSVCSSICHGIGQVGCAAILYGSFYMMFYLPIISIAGCITGLLIAILSALTIRQLEKIGFAL